MAYLLMEQRSVQIKNAIAQLGGVEILILAGLNKHQKSYLRIEQSQQITLRV